mgnify:FL=1
MIKPNNNQRVQAFRGSNCRGTYCIYNAEDNKYYSEKSNTKQKGVMRWTDATVTNVPKDDFVYVPEFAVMLGGALKDDLNLAKADFYKSKEYKQRKANGDRSVDFSDPDLIENYDLSNPAVKRIANGDSYFKTMGRLVDALVGKNGSVKPVVEAIVKSIREERERSQKG